MGDRHPRAFPDQDYLDLRITAVVRLSQKRRAQMYSINALISKLPERFAEREKEDEVII
jgi:hypothetical protein